MLQTIRKYRRSVLGFVGVGLVALAMGGFGINMGSSQRGNYAIKVGDREISYDDFAQVRRNIDSRYRQMFGENYAELLKTFNINVAQQAVDSAIHNALLEGVAEQLGLAAGPQSVQEIIHNELFAGQFDPQRYASFLSAQGISAVQFENGLREDIARQQLVNLFTDASKSSLHEAKAMLARDKTRFSFHTLTINPEDVTKSVNEPSAEQLDQYYTNNLTDFQTPAKVKYQYSILEPTDILSKVPVTQDDIELEYTENPSAYQTSPEIRLSQILLRIPENASDEAKEKIRKSAQDISSRLKGSEKFEELAKLYSQDPPSAIKGGDTGWLTLDKLPKSVSDKAFALELASISDPIETEKAIYIVRLEDRKDSQLRPLDEVKSDILAKLQNRDAPSVLVLHAQDLFEQWNKSDKSLADFVKENALKEAKTSEALSKDQAPEPILKDLTANILLSPETKRQLLEAGDRQIFVQVEESIEESVEPFDSVKSKITEILKKNAAVQEARLKANQVLELIKNDSSKSLKDAASEFGFKTEEVVDATPSSAKGVVADPQIRDRAFGFNSAPQKPTEVFEIDNKFVLVEVSAIKSPSSEDLTIGLDNMQKGLDKELSDFSLEAFISKLKSETTIDVQPGLLVEQ